MISLLTTTIPHISRLCCSSGHVGNVRIVNTLDALEKTPCTPFVPCFCPLISTMLEQSRCSTSQFVPLQVENNTKRVKQKILDFDFELLIDIRKEASMSKVVPQS